MGGRGSKSGSNGGGRLSLPEISGTEKQVSWAKDILTNPHETMLANAKLNEKRRAEVIKKSGKAKSGNDYKQEADAYAAAGKRYKAEIAKLPKSMKASQIIDRRDFITNVAETIINDEFKKRKIASSFRFPRGKN